LKDYEALEKHVYAIRARVPPGAQHQTTEEFRADTSSDEAFNPLNTGLRRG
jgi:hypothetical protein